MSKIPKLPTEPCAETFGAYYRCEQVSKIIKLPGVEERTGKSRSAIYRDMKEGTFPAPVKIGKRAVGWREDDINQWMSELPSRAGSIYKDARKILAGKAGA